MCKMTACDKRIRKTGNTQEKRVRIRDNNLARVIYGVINQNG